MPLIIFISLFFSFSLYADNLVNLSCEERVLMQLPKQDDGFGCEASDEFATQSFRVRDEWYFPVLPKTYLRCHFASRHTSYYYQHDGKHYLDIRGQGLENGKAFEFERCDAAITKLSNEADKEAQLLFSAPVSRALKSNESILVVASQRNCQMLSDSLAQLIEHYQNERRVDSKLLCLKPELIKEKNPASIRNAIHAVINRQSIDGIILVGMDIPPFELFYIHNKQGSHGHSDLPYGELASEFWRKPIDKSDASLKGKVFYDKPGYVYQTEHPSRYAYNLTNASEVIKQTYQQKLWVTRWLPSYTDTSLVLGEFDRFVSKRLHYAPTVGQRLLMMSEYYRLGLGYFNNHYDQKRVDEFLKYSPHSEAKFYSYSSFHPMVKNLPEHTSLLVLDAHGSGHRAGSIDSMDYYSFSELTVWPEIVLLSNCLNGMWGIFNFNDGVNFPGTLLASAVLNSESKPLAVIASQLSTSFHYMGPSSEMQKESFFTSFTEGQSLGRRQVDVVNVNVKYFNKLYNNGRFDQIGNWDKDAFLAALYIDLLASVSIFGDGSIEF